MEKMRQTRNFKDIHLTTRAETEEKIIEGYFAVFDKETELFPGAFEKIDKNAFASQLNADVRALINHDTTLVLGRTTAGTLRLSTDERGLYGVIKVNPYDLDALNLYERIKRGDVNQCSFGFFIKDEDVEHRSDGSTCWTIKDVNLFEVSACTFPAYENTGIQARHKELEQYEKRKMEKWKTEMKGRLNNVKSNLVK